MIVHAGLVAEARGGRLRGVLITGASGSGKSDLALRLLDEGFLFAADDRVELWTSGGKLYGRAPDAIFGMMEVRGVGLRPRTAVSFAPISLIAALDEPEKLERHPEPECETLLGLEVQLIRMAGFEVSAPAKLRQVLMTLG